MPGCRPIVLNRDGIPIQVFDISAGILLEVSWWHSRNWRLPGNDLKTFDLRRAARRSNREPFFLLWPSFYAIFLGLVELSLFPFGFSAGLQLGFHVLLGNIDVLFIHNPNSLLQTMHVV